MSPVSLNCLYLFCFCLFAHEGKLISWAPKMRLTRCTVLAYRSNNALEKHALIVHKVRCQQERHCALPGCLEVSHINTRHFVLNYSPVATTVTIIGNSFLLAHHTRSVNLLLSCVYFHDWYKIIHLKDASMLCDLLKDLILRTQKLLDIP